MKSDPALEVLPALRSKFVARYNTHRAKYLIAYVETVCIENSITIRADWAVCIQSRDYRRRINSLRHSDAFITTCITSRIVIRKIIFT